MNHKKDNRGVTLSRRTLVILLVVMLLLIAGGRHPGAELAPLVWLRHTGPDAAVHPGPGPQRPSLDGGAAGG